LGLCVLRRSALCLAAGNADAESEEFESAQEVRISALDVKESGRRSRYGRYRLIGLGFLAIPIAILTLFTVGEGIGGESGWWGHLIQLAIGLGLAAGAWFAPKLGGSVLIGAGIVFSGMMLGTNQEWASKLSAIAILFVPLIVAGVLFRLAALEEPLGASNVE